MHATQTQPDALDRRVWDAHGDAWQAQGRLREGCGGGAAEMPGIRLMASGLPHAQWNNGDVTQPDEVPWNDVRAWYAARAGRPGRPLGRPGARRHGLPVRAAALSQTLHGTRRGPLSPLLFSFRGRNPRGKP